MIARVQTYASFVRFSHSVFALPFALVGFLLATRLVPFSWTRIGWVIACMVSARSAAMGFNRLADAEYDARNPRTATRELPSGAISLRAAWTLTLVATAVFVGAAAALGPLCLALSPVALLFLYGYSFTKRFTSLCHLFLGLAIASGPGGAWIAVRGDFGWVPGLLMIAVGAWIAGFDVLYALSDRDFDRATGLHSIPARFGVTGSLVISALLHAVTVAALIALAPVAGLGVPYLVGVGVVVALLAYEHAIVRPSDLSRLDIAFFTLNGYVSIAFFAATLADVLFR